MTEENRDVVLSLTMLGVVITLIVGAVKGCAIVNNPATIKAEAEATTTIMIQRHAIESDNRK